MNYSSHNIFSKLKDSDKYFIVNLLSGNADILDKEIALNYLEKKIVSDKEWIEKGYVVDEAEERRFFENEFQRFLNEQSCEELQLFFVPTYACNFGCRYCYQDQYANPNQSFNNAVIDAFFDYIKATFKGRRYYITLFGGEPLLNSNNQKLYVEYFLNKATENKIDIAVVTNGYYLEEYLPILKKSRIREIQVTLDGTAIVHNQRRPLRDGSPTFEKIANGIDKTLMSGIPVNLRFVVDKENISELPALAEYCIKQGWTASSRFKTQIGRNYELHHCQEKHERLFTRISLNEALYELTKEYPVILKFHKPAFSVARYLKENGELPEPLFDACPACKSEWAFDYTGKIYSCTATVGKSGEELGTFYPEIKLNHDTIREWQSRNITTIEECKTCNLALACGGGCGSLAKNKTGKINSPDCRPIKELLELGIARYFGE